MSKQHRDFERIDDYVERFSKEPTETLLRRLNSGSIYKEARIAIKRVLSQREKDSGE